MGCSKHACVSRETLETNPEKILRKILTKKFGKKNWKKNLKKIQGKKFYHSYNHEKNPAWGARNTRVSRAKPSKQIPKKF